ncbi:MAG TPA: glycosyltransferase family 4 protein [Thermodesulfobacteriota bacterium]
MIRVVQVITKLELGGAQQLCLELCRRLDRRRFEVVLVSGAEGELVAEARRLPDVRFEAVRPLVREVSPAADAAALAALVRLLRRERRTARGPLVVHTHSSKAGVLGRLAARLAGVRHVVHTIHGYAFHAGQPPAVRRLYQAIERVASRWADALVAVAEENRRTGIALGLFRPERCEVIPGGIDVAAFSRPPEARERARAALGLPAGSGVVGMVACLKPQKAPEDFVAVAARVRAAVPGTRFLIAGDGERRAAVEAAARAAGLDGDLRLLGWRRDVPDILAALDVLVLTSRWEGLPLVFPQAMAAGRPVVATNVNGAPEAVREGVTGHLVPPGDVEALADRVIDLLRNPDRRRAMGEAARSAAAAFDVGAMTRRHEALYERLVARERGAA